MGAVGNGENREALYTATHEKRCFSDWLNVGKKARSESGKRSVLHDHQGARLSG